MPRIRDVVKGVVTAIKTKTAQQTTKKTNATLGTKMPPSTPPRPSTPPTIAAALPGESPARTTVHVDNIGNTIIRIKVSESNYEKVCSNLLKSGNLANDIKKIFLFHTAEDPIKVQYDENNKTFWDIIIHTQDVEKQKALLEMLANKKALLHLSTQSIDQISLLPPLSTEKKPASQLGKPTGQKPTSTTLQPPKQEQKKPMSPAPAAQKQQPPQQQPQAAKEKPAKPAQTPAAAVVKPEAPKPAAPKEKVTEPIQAPTKTVVPAPAAPQPVTVAAKPEAPKPEAPKEKIAEPVQTPKQPAKAEAPAPAAPPPAAAVAKPEAAKEKAAESAQALAQPVKAEAPAPVAPQPVAAAEKPEAPKPEAPKEKIAEPAKTPAKAETPTPTAPQPDATKEKPAEAKVTPIDPEKLERDRILRERYEEYVEKIKALFPEGAVTITVKEKEEEVRLAFGNNSNLCEITRRNLSDYQKSGKHDVGNNVTLPRSSKLADMLFNDNRKDMWRAAFRKGLEFDQQGETAVTQKKAPPTITTKRPKHPPQEKQEDK